jgi:hypothetical protein
MIPAKIDLRRLTGNPKIFLDSGLSPRGCSWHARVRLAFIFFGLPKWRATRYEAIIDFCAPCIVYYPYVDDSTVLFCLRLYNTLVGVVGIEFRSKME